MENKEFDLSEKIVKMAPKYIADDVWLHVGDVKEFIRLEDELILNLAKGTIGFCELNEKRHELLGKELGGGA